MYYVYILCSLKDSSYYIGYTGNLERRVQDHNRGRTQSGKNRGPFQLVHYEKAGSRLEAAQREKRIKSYKGGNAFRKLLKKKHVPIV